MQKVGQDVVVIELDGDTHFTSCWKGFFDADDDETTKETLYVNGRTCVRDAVLDSMAVPHYTIDVKAYWESKEAVLWGLLAFFSGLQV